MPNPVSLRRLHYAWVVFAITFLTLIVTAAVRSAPGVLIVPLEKEFGWTRSTISAAISINLLLYGLIGPFAAGLMNRFGVRKVMLVSLTLLSGGVILTTAVRAPWQLNLLWGILVGAGTGMLAIVLGTTVVHRWFRIHQGLAVGILTASTATGQLLFLPLLAHFVEQDGWRVAVSVLVGALFLVLVVVAVGMRSAPADIGARAFGQADDEPDSEPDREANPFREALAALALGMRSKDFWLLAGSFFICGASTNGLIGTHLIPACIDHGISEVGAAGLLAMMGIFDLIGTTASGWLSDRFSNRWLLFAYYGLRGISLLFLPQAFDPTFTRLPIFAVFYGLDWIATVPPTVALTARIFGRAKVGLMFGWIVAAHQIGAGAIAYLAGFIRTNQGSYDQAFLLSGAACILTAAAVLWIGNSPADLADKGNTIEAPGAYAKIRQ
ncbi:MAG: MFS transporter [Chthoniobacterales bacterium]